MELLTFFLSLCVLFVSIYFLLLKPKRPKNFPPGPTGIPFFENALQLGAQGHRPAMEYGKKYGDILGLHLGSYRVVVLNNADDIRAAFGMAEISGRYGFNNLMDENPGVCNAGLLLSSGTPWIDHRRFTLRTLRDFGFGKRSLEHIIQEEVSNLMEIFRKSEGQIISTQQRFNAAIFNVIWSIVAGQRFDLNDPKLTELMGLLFDFLQNNLQGVRVLFFFFPAFVEFRNLFPFLFSDTSEKFRQKLFNFFRTTIREHRETLDPENLRDFIDSYLEEARKQKDNPNSSFKSDDDDFSLIATLMDFFVAGGETTSTTLSWAFFLLAHHPEVQEKLFKEIVAQGAVNRPVALADRVNMQYTECVMHEIYRMSSLVPMGIPHATLEDVVFKGYNIPKNTLVFGNAYAAHHDERIWGDPKKFRPDRFLGADGKTFVRHKSLIPFSTGKRQCMGETLARDEFFLMLTNSVQNFVISMPSDEPPHSFEGQPGAVATPEPHRIILKSR